ncbi:MAG: hypothetical protein ABW185_25040, partial [Sedimenticola sp.]
KNKIREEVASDLSTMREELSKELTNAMESKFKEREDIAKRERNLFIYKVQESKKTDAKKRVDHDRQFMKSLGTELGVPDPKISSIIRVGKLRRNENGEINYTNPRPIRTTFIEKSERRQILTNARLLKNPTNKDLASVSISRDITVAERESYKLLESELRSRKDKGETDLYISRGKIMKRSAAEGDDATASSTGEPF